VNHVTSRFQTGSPLYTESIIKKFMRSGYIEGVEAQFIPAFSDSEEFPFPLKVTMIGIAEPFSFRTTLPSFNRKMSEP